MDIGYKRDLYIIGSVLYIVVNFLAYYQHWHITLFAGQISPQGINYLSLGVFLFFIWFAGDSPVISDNGALIVDLLLLSLLLVMMLITQDLLSIHSNFWRWVVSALISFTIITTGFLLVVYCKNRQNNPTKNNYHSNYYY